MPESESNKPSVISPGSKKKAAARKIPKTNMEIAVLARGRVRRMVNVLTDIAENEEATPSARVSAAKSLIDFARIKPEDVKDLGDQELLELGKKIVELQSTSDGAARKLKRVIDGGKLPQKKKA